MTAAAIAARAVFAVGVTHFFTRRSKTADAPLTPAREQAGRPARDSLALPTAPQAAEPRRFPVFATIAPVVASIVLWAVTRSVYILAFAALGPTVALATIGDNAFHGRRSRARERVRFDREAREFRESVDRAHAAERAGLVRRHPGASAIVRSSLRDAERWRASAEAELEVVVGQGSRASTLVVTGESAASTGNGHCADELDALGRLAATLDDAPVTVDARLGIGICGRHPLPAAIARGIVLQVANLLSPERYDIVLPERRDGERWLEALPHSVHGVATQPGTVAFRARGGESHDVLISVADTADQLPRDCRIVLRAAGGAAVRVMTALAPEGTQVTPEFISREHASASAAVLREAAHVAGWGRSSGGVPDLVEFSALHPVIAADRGSRESDRRALDCVPLASEHGALVLDLVRDGPHALIGGTTGSGKSELLTAWALAMASVHSPDEVNFLLVDFKGGSTFAGVENLPHSVGLITDLDAGTAQRALASLTAELRYRERLLASADARAIEQLGADHPLARLVILVDEFAAMMQDFPELHEIFADIASRGRSLGVHLILCTQRPAGVVRDAILANCTLRISLRVNNAADSKAVVGTDVAAMLPRFPPGRAVVCLPGEEPIIAQTALATAEDCVEVVSGWNAAIREGVRPRRPWCDPLPPTIALADLLGDAGSQHRDGERVLGLADLPHEQRQDLAVYQPALHGNLVVLGGYRSGKTGVLDVLLADAGEVDRDGPDTTLLVPADPEAAWDLVTGELDAVRHGDVTERLLLIDDVDALIGAYAEEYALAFSEALCALLREGSRGGRHCVVTARRVTAAVQSIVAMCDSRLVLRMADRQEHVLATGGSSGYDPLLRPGGGLWHGDRVQVAVAPQRSVAPVSHSGTEAEIEWAGWPGLIVVTGYPADLARSLEGEQAGRVSAHVSTIGGWRLVQPQSRPPADTSALAVETSAPATIVVLDPDTWQSQWNLVTTLRTTMPVVFDRCTTSDFRAVSRLRALPPPIAPGSPAAWFLSPDGHVRRVTPPWRSQRS